MMLTVFFVVGALIDDTPMDVKIQLKRGEHLVNKILLEVRPDYIVILYSNFM